HLPQPGEPDLRGFEWYYLEHLCRSDLLTLKSGSGALNNVVFSPDGKYLASGGINTAIRIWNASTGETTFSETGTDGWVHCVAFSPDGKLLASSGGKKDHPGEITIRDAIGGKEMQSWKDLPEGTLRLAFSPDGTKLALASPNGAEVRDLASGQVLLT